MHARTLTTVGPYLGLGLLLVLSTLLIASSPSSTAETSATPHAPLQFSGARTGTMPAGPAAPGNPALPCGIAQCIYFALGTSNGVGNFNPTNNFNPGSIGGGNHVFFHICDYGLDHNANITIDDQNASRDGLTNPVKQFYVPLTLYPGSGCPGGTSFDSTQAPQVFFTVPSSLVLGGTWTFNVTAGNLGSSMHQQEFQVATYFVALSVDRTNHLPGDHATVYYQVLSYVSQGPVTGSLTFSANGLYSNSTRPYYVIALPPITPPSGAAQGSLAFLVPTNAKTNTLVQVNLWANLSVAGGSNTALASVLYSVAQVVAPALCASTTVDGGPTPCPTPLAFPQGSELVVREVAQLGTLGGTPTGPIPGATITLQLFEGGLPVSAPPSFPTQVTADASGTAKEVLDTTLIQAASITINVTVTDPFDTVLTNHSSLTVALLGASSQVAVEIALNATQYFGGDTLGGTFQLVQPGGSGGVPAFWTAYAFQVYFDSGASACPYLPTGFLQVQGNLTGSQGTVPSYTLGLTMNGLVEVVIFAHNGSSASALGIFSMACALVSPPQVLVNPSEVNYLPGDTISVSVQGEGSVLAGATYYANVVGFATVMGHAPCSGTTMQVLFGGAVQGSSFTFQVPKLGASLCYEVSVSAQGSGGFVTGQDLELDEVSGFALSSYVATVSQYADGSYQPGQTISLSYQISPLGSASLPRTVTLLVQVGNLPFTRTQQASTSGSLSVTIPSDQGGGVLLIYVEAAVADPNIAGGVDYISTTTGVLVHPNPSFLDQQLPAGSGFTGGDLVLVAVLAALVVLGLFLWRRSQWRSSSGHFHRDHGPHGEVAAPATSAAPAGPMEEVAPDVSSGDPGLFTGPPVPPEAPSGLPPEPPVLPGPPPPPSHAP